MHRVLRSLGQEHVRLHLCYLKFMTYVIAYEVGMVLLNAIIQDSDHYTSSCVALSPGCFCIQILMCWVGLEETKAFVQLSICHDWLFRDKMTEKVCQWKKVLHLLQRPSLLHVIKNSIAWYTWHQEDTRGDQRCFMNILNSHFNASPRYVCLLRMSCPLWTSYCCFAVSEKERQPVAGQASWGESICLSYWRNNIRQHSRGEGGRQTKGSGKAWFGGISENLYSLKNKERWVRELTEMVTNKHRYTGTERH